MPVPSCSFPDSTTDGDGRDVPVCTNAHDRDLRSSPGGTYVKFHIGDKVQVGMRVGTITDVGTVLIQVKTSEASLRVVCPWEVVRIIGRHDSHD